MKDKKKASPLRIGLIGASGRMGRAVTALATSQTPIVPFTSAHPPTPSAPVDVFLDLSLPAALMQNLQTALLAKKPIVVGTTGHADFTSLEAAARSIPVFYSANFSLGIALMNWAAAECAKRFPHTASIELIEAHHAEKKDAPSGTALLLARTIEARRPGKVKIQSIRSGQVVGNHALHFHSSDERLSLVHETLSRDAFASGALKACRFLALKTPGFYTMSDLLR